MLVDTVELEQEQKGTTGAHGQKHVPVQAQDVRHVLVHEEHIHSLHDGQALTLHAKSVEPGLQTILGGQILETVQSITVIPGIIGTANANRF